MPEQSAIAAVGISWHFTKDFFCHNLSGWHPSVLLDYQVSFLDLLQHFQYLWVYAMRAIQIYIIHYADVK